MTKFQTHKEGKKRYCDLFIKILKKVADPETASCLPSALTNVSSAASICFVQPAVLNKDILKAGLSHT